MKKTKFIFKVYILFFLLLFVHSTIIAQTNPVTKTNDTTKVVKKNDTIKLKYPFKNDQTGSLYLADPSKTEITYDAELGKYMIVEKIGDFILKRPIFMTGRV